MNYDILAKEAADKDGVLTVKMETLKQISGMKRLGPNVCAAISEELKKRDLSHYPNVLPLDQQSYIYLYHNKNSTGSLMGTVINLLLQPHEGTGEIITNLLKCLGMSLARQSQQTAASTEVAAP